MKKISYKHINNLQLVDIRSQYKYQLGHLQNSLNLIPSNFKKYATYYLDVNEPVAFIVDYDEKIELENLSEIADTLGFNQNYSYLLIDEIDQENLQSMGTISAKDFLEFPNDFILIDDRQPDEITRPAPKKNLINISFEDLANAYTALDSNKQMFTLCGSGNRSTAAASFLKSKGLNVKVIEGGMKAIQEIAL